jgi:hypothetical protein
MTDEQINIAIAEACGRVQRPDGYWFPPGSNVGSAGIANYCNDLNAMREAEMTLPLGRNRKQWGNSLAEFRCYLRLIAGHGGSIHATARQRAEAFLRTLGKWEEQP